MKQWLARKGLSLIPADEKAVKAIKRLGEGEAILLAMERSRSPEWHRWFMGGCAAIAEGIAQSGDRQLTTHAVKEVLKLYAGHIDKVRDKYGNETDIPRSIAFDKLDADEWAELFPSLDAAAHEHFGFDFQLFKDGLSGFYE